MSISGNDVRSFSCYMNLWRVAVPELDSDPGRNKGPDHAPSNRSLILAILQQTTNPLIVRPLSGGPNCAW